MTERAANLIFAATAANEDGGYSEIAITDTGCVYLLHQARGGGPLRSEEVRKRRRDIDELLTDIENLGITEWARCYGPEQPFGPGSWHVVMEGRGKFYRSQGTGEYPPGWEELCELLAKFLGRPFGSSQSQAE